MPLTKKISADYILAEAVTATESVQTIETLIPVFASIFDSSIDNIAVFSLSGKPVYMNAALMNTLNVGDYQDDDFKFVWMQEHNIFAQALKEALESQTAHSILFDYEHPSLSRRIYDVIYFSPIKNSDDTFIGVYTAGCDLNLIERQNNAYIKKQESYLRALLDTFPFMVWMKDKENRFLATNAMFAEVAGVSSHLDLKDKTDYDFFPREMAQGYVNDDAEVLTTGRPKTTVEKILKKNGEEYWAETYKSPVMIGGNVIGTVGFAKDITERNDLISTIETKELEYAALVKNIPISIIRYDLEGRRLFANASKRDFLSEDIGSLIGKTPLELWNPNIINMTGQEFQQKLMEVIQTAGCQRFELLCQYNDVQHCNTVTLVPEFNSQNVVVGALALASDITEISHYRQSLEHLAYHDALTELPNRSLLNLRMRTAIEHAAQYQNKFGLLFLDLDYFKSINDTLGHAIGDELLIEASKRISKTLRTSDVVARIGGDEFAILVMDVKDNSDLSTLAQKIANTLAEPFNIDGISFFITASTGIACYPEDSDNIEDLMKYADTAMYLAKKQGRNNFQFYTPELTQNVVEQLAIATALRYAIQKNELTLHYQPLVDVVSGKILGAEALMRWNGKVLGQIPPDKFIPIAEESGLINNIGAWALEQACEAAARLNLGRQSPFVIAVNISSRQFAGQDFIAILEQCLLKTGCKCAWLTLEITESLLLQDNELILNALNKIDQMGITLAIDDFGTGYSALAYLSKFPIRQVKIDRSFVIDITNNPGAANLVKAIIAMAQSLHKDLVAEGIETQPQASLLQSYGCHQGQGYLYSKPVPYHQLLTLLNS